MGFQIHLVLRGWGGVGSGKGPENFWNLCLEMARFIYGLLRDENFIGLQCSLLLTLVDLVNEICHPVKH